MKRGLFVFGLLLLLISAVSAADTFMISFHSLGGNESISIDLVEYLKDPGPFKYSPVKNVDIVIDKGIATISPKDPAWVGIEDIIFAPLGVEIKLPETPGEEEYKLARQALLNRTVSKEELDTALGSEMGESFYAITSNMTGKPINISGFLTKDSVSLEINNEVSLNISVKEDSRSLNPEFAIDVHTSRDGLSLPEYDVPFNWQIFLFVLLIVVSVAVIFAYFYTGYAQNIFSAIVMQEKKVRKGEVSVALKRSAHARLSALKKQLAADNAKSVLKESMGVVDSFFSSCLHISFVGKDKVLGVLSQRKAPSSLQNAVASLYDDYAAMMYGKAEVSKGRVSAFISKAAGVISSI